MGDTWPFAARLVHAMLEAPPTMDIPTLLHTHVYTAIVLGSLVEGETTVVLAGFAAHQGYAPWWAVTLLAAVVNFAWDQALFALGRWRGDWVLGKAPRLREGVQRIAPLIHRHRRWVVFGVRFMYGLRTAGPIALGLARIRWLDFVVFNALGAVVWALLFAGLGYAFGNVIASVIGVAAHYEALAAGGILLVGVAVFSLHHWRRGRLRATRMPGP
ncbi:MAG TPA: DedA family protein [Burkholderiaceae bacterium]|nr:DedA family protein [Burkholderiaceae bacterium]